MLQKINRALTENPKEKKQELNFFILLAERSTIKLSIDNFTFVALCL